MRQILSKARGVNDNRSSIVAEEDHLPSGPKTIIKNIENVEKLELSIVLECSKKKLAYRAIVLSLADLCADLIQSPKKTKTSPHVERIKLAALIEKIRVSLNNATAAYQIKSQNKKIYCCPKLVPKPTTKKTFPSPVGVSKFLSKLALPVPCDLTA